MTRRDYITRINDLNSFHTILVINNTKAGLNDIARHAENLLIPILKRVLHYNLENANLFQKNHPAVDLIDKKKGIAFQVSANTAPNKVIETLIQFKVRCTNLSGQSKLLKFDNDDRKGFKKDTAQV